MTKQEKAYPWQDDIPEGHIRLYTDHTCRWYEDITFEEYKRRSEIDDPLWDILQEEVRKEIDKDIIEKIRNSLNSK